MEEFFGSHTIEFLGAILATSILAVVGVSLFRRTKRAAKRAPGAQTYSPLVLENGARALLRRASLVVALYATFGGIGGIVLLGAVTAFGAKSDFLAWVSTLAPIVVFLIMGESRAAALRFQAQSLLCQLQIEQNTRALAEAITGTKSRNTNKEHYPHQAT